MDRRRAREGYLAPPDRAAVTGRRKRSRRAGNSDVAYPPLHGFRPRQRTGAILARDGAMIYQLVRLSIGLFSPVYSLSLGADARGLVRSHLPLTVLLYVNLQSADTKAVGLHHFYV